MKPLRNKRFTIYEFEGQTYKIDRRLFQALFIVMLLLFFIAWAFGGFGDPRFMNFKMQCPNESYRVGGCENPFYKVYDYSFVPKNIIELKTLPPGFYYGKNNPLADNFIIIMVTFIFFAFIFNHLIYNKGFKFSAVKKHFNKSIEDINRGGKGE